MAANSTAAINNPDVVQGHVIDGATLSDGHNQTEAKLLKQDSLLSGEDDAAQVE